MDVWAAGGIPVSVELITAAKQEKLATAVGAGVLKMGLDLQKDLMAELFQAMGIGQNVDVKA